MFRSSNAAKSEDTRGEAVLPELRREYHCMAYNALAAIIACTQTEMKFYTAFLFTENLAKVRHIAVLCCVISYS